MSNHHRLISFVGGFAGAATLGLLTSLEAVVLIAVLGVATLIGARFRRPIAQGVSWFFQPPTRRPAARRRRD